MNKRKDGFNGQKAIVLPPPILELLEKNEITRLLHITDIGYYPRANGHFREREQGSMQHILIYCIEGEGWFNVEGQEHKVCKNQFFIIEAGKPHLYAADENKPWSIYWLHFMGDKSLLFQPFYNRLHAIDNVVDTRHDDRLQFLENIYKNLEMGYNMDNLQYVTLCLWHLLGSFFFIPQFSEIKDIGTSDTIQCAINYMKNNIEKKLTLEDIATRAGYSPSYFGQLFLKRTGYAPLSYFNQLKVQKACSLLDFSNLKIKEIAYQLGFYDQYHFSKIFHNQIGESPNVYRNRRKG